MISELIVITYALQNLRGLVKIYNGSSKFNGTGEDIMGHPWQLHVQYAVGGCEVISYNSDNNCCLLYY